jgi:hypothetical protein
LDFFRGWGRRRGCGKTEMGHSVEGKLLQGQQVRCRNGEICMAVGRQIVLRTTLGCRPIIGPGPPPDLFSDLGRPEVAVDLAGDVALEHPDDLALGGNCSGV